MATEMFSIGSGFSGAAVIGILGRWLESGGIHPGTRLGGVPIAQALHNRLSRRFGAGRFRIFRGNLDVFEGGQWRQLVHRDDIRTWMFGKEVAVRVGNAPDPAEKGIEVEVGIAKAIDPKKVVGYFMNDDDRWECEECGKDLKTEKGIIAHIERDH